jgi:hypothetical protein
MRKNWRQDITWKCKLNTVAWFREELYRPNDSRLSGKLVTTFPGRGCHVISVTDPYGCLCGLVVWVPGYRSRASSSIPGATRFSEKLLVWNGVGPVSFVSTTEELLGRRSSGYSLENVGTDKPLLQKIIRVYVVRVWIEFVWLWILNCVRLL